MDVCHVVLVYFDAERERKQTHKPKQKLHFTARIYPLFGYRKIRQSQGAAAHLQT